MDFKQKANKYLLDSYNYIEKIVDLALQQDKKIIMWGYGKGGVYARHLIKDIDGRIDVVFFIDDYLYIPYAPETRIFRSSKLNYIDINQYILISSVKNADEISEKVKAYGFIENENYFDVRSVVKASNIEYIQSNIVGIDFDYVTKEDRPDLYSGFNYESKPFDHSSVDRVFDEISKLSDDIRFFDYGFGKGQMLLNAYISGIENIGGIELNDDIYAIAKRNMKILNVPCELICGNACEYHDIDEYNVFFFYNPFGGEVFEKVISNIEKSVRQKPRKMFIVYGNPFNHKAVIAQGVFRLVKQIPVDLYDPLLNIYTNI